MGGVAPASRPCSRPWKGSALGELCPSEVGPFNMLVVRADVLEQRGGEGAVDAGAVLGARVGRARERDVRALGHHLDHALGRRARAARHALEDAAAVEDEDGEDAAAVLHVALDLMRAHRLPGEVALVGTLGRRHELRAPVGDGVSERHQQRRGATE